MHAIAGKAVAFREAMEPSFRDYQAQTLKKCTGDDGNFHGKGIQDCLRRYRQSLIPA